MVQRNDEQLKVNVSFVVNRDGTLRDIQTVGKVDKQLGKTCIEAISKWKFQPAMGYDGRPLNVRVSVPITFVTQDS
jgi:TonB family protein